MDVQHQRRNVQYVSTLSARKAVVQWMIMDSELHPNRERGLISRTIQTWPEHFPGAPKANRMKAKLWWDNQDEIVQRVDNANPTPLVVTRACVGRWSKTKLKARAGRGRKRAPWVTWLYGKMFMEFERVRAAGVKISPNLLRDMAWYILRNSEEEFMHQTIDPVDGINILQKITPSWIQSFMMKNNLVYREQNGRLICSLQKKCRGFNSGEFNENYVENIDETHFVFNVDNSRTVGHRGDISIKYADVVSGGESITMVVRLTGGQRACIKNPMLIFTNTQSNYPIQGVPNNIPGVCYRSGPSGWMDSGLFAQYFNDPRAYQADLYGHPKIVWVDNSSSHNRNPILDTILQEKNTELRYLPPCTTHLVQPADQFVIAKIKNVWERKWQQKKMELIREKQWSNQPERRGRGWSGKFKNPGKQFYLSLAADCIREVNGEIDERGVSFACKTMIKCGLSMDLDGTWRKEQLLENLQRIIADHPQVF